jgi:hypothetical protein
VGIAFIVALLVLGSPVQAAQEPNNNGGILSGPGFAFILVAPDGWVLDDVSGQKEGLPAVFYKRGDSWSRAKVVMYANPVRRSKGETLKGIIAADVTRFRKLNPGIVVEDGVPLAVANGRKLQVKVFRGTQAGDTEVVAYADESSCVVMLVLSGTEDRVRGARSSFGALLRSYIFITTDVRDNQH